MTSKADIRQELERVTHASQTKGVVATLLAYLDEAGVKSPDDIELEQKMAYQVELHRRLAEAETAQEVDDIVAAVEDDEDGTDEAFVRAAAERRAVLEQQEAAETERAALNDRDYGTLTRPELVKQAGARGLPAGGTKDELVARLRADDQAKADQQ